MIVEDELDPVGDVREHVHGEEENKGDRGVVAHHAHLPDLQYSTAVQLVVVHCYRASTGTAYSAAISESTSGCARLQC